MGKLMLAASDLASGRPLRIKNMPEELIMYSLMEKHHWTPDQIRKIKYKDIKAMLGIDSIFQKVRDSEMKKSKKGKR